MIWLNLLIPFIAIIAMLVFFRKKMAVWEYAIIFLIPIIAITIGKISSVRTQLDDTEYWNYHLTHAVYEEYWSAYVSQTCTRTVSCGKNCTTIQTYDCSYCDENSEKWYAFDNSGKKHTISKSHFEYLCKIWGNREFKDMNRKIRHSGRCGVDGDAYVTKWNREFETIQPVCILTHYQNRTQCSKTVFNFMEVDSSDSVFYGLHRYPYYEKMGKFNYDPIVGWNDPKASDRLQKWNGKLGMYRKVHMMIGIYVDKTQKTALMQEANWKRGNKNEFILLIGLDKSKKSIDWTYVMSWSDKEKLKIDVRDSVANMAEFDLIKIIDYMAGEVSTRFEKKNFDDFSYIKVEPTPMAIFWTFFIVLVLTTGLCVFSVVNPFDAGSTFNGGHNIHKRYRY